MMMLLANPAGTLAGGAENLTHSFQQDQPCALRSRPPSRCRGDRACSRSSFPKGNVYMTMRDQLGPIYTIPVCRSLSPAGTAGRSALAAGLTTLFQFAENLSDRQAADAVRSRIDWKYAMGLELTDPGYDYSILSEFRSRLLHGQPKGGSWTLSWHWLGSAAG